MRLIRWTTGIARSLRGLVVRVHRRTEPLPQLPFGIAVGVAVLLLITAIETGFDPDAAVTEVDELSLSDRYEDVDDEYATTPAELQIVEFGFGRVTDPQGVERLSLGAVVRNPQDSVVMPITLAVVSVSENGTRSTLERIYLDVVPAESSVPVGYVLLEPAGDIDEDALDLVVEEAWTWEPPEGADWYPLGESASRVEVDVVDIEPLFSPEGYRVSYRVEARGEPDGTETMKMTVVFRDGDGAIIGGMPAWGDPFNDNDGLPAGYHPAPHGVSLQYLDLPAEYIPEGADLNKIEIGPGV